MTQNLLGMYYSPSSVLGATEHKSNSYLFGLQRTENVISC